MANLGDLLAAHKRLAITGPSGCGKTTLSMQVSDRPVFHTDDWLDSPHADVPELIKQTIGDLDSFVIEGCTVPRALRYGLEVDAVLFLEDPKREQTPGQITQGKGIKTVFQEWREANPEVPVVTEESFTFPTLDKSDFPLKTKRYSTFTLDAAKAQPTPQGGLRIPARASKAGVFKYQRGRNVLREYRPASELKKAYQTLKSAPVVVLHPAVNGGEVDTNNARMLQVGNFEDPFFNEETQAIEGWVVINDADTLQKIEAGELADISCGYANERDVTPGVTEDQEPYDLIQTDYVFNHVALGPPGWGRQGQDVGLTLDSKDNQVAPEPPKPHEETMAQDKKATVKTVDEGIQPPAPPAAPAGPPAAPAAPPQKTEDEALTPEDIAALKALVKLVPELNRVLNTGGGSETAGPAGPPTADTDTTEQKPAAAQPPTMDAADVERLVSEGAEVRKEAEIILGDKYSSKGKTTRQVRVDVIKTFDSAFDDKGMSEREVKSSYSLALKFAEERAKNSEHLSSIRHARFTEDSGAPKQVVTNQVAGGAYDAWKK